MHSLAGTKSYVVGSGSDFNLINHNGSKVRLSIYVAESSFSKLGMEYYFVGGDFSRVEVWQRFNLGIGVKSLSLDEGYVLSSEMKKPEIMTRDFMENNKKGVQIDDFMFSDEAELEKFKVGLESVEVPAGKILCSHYRKARGDQTVDFWISDKAGAIGLVKLTSNGANNKDHDFKLELLSLLKNVRPKINPKEAVPLTDKGRMFIGK